MYITQVNLKDKVNFDKLAVHPLQSWEWGEFREKTGIKVIRMGKYDNNKLVETIQLTIHQIPYSPFSIGYIPKSQIPSREMLKGLVSAGKKNNCIFIKLEPSVIKNNLELTTDNLQLTTKSPHPLFTKYTFRLDLTSSEEELLKSLHPKTRYNIKVAQKHGVIIKEDSGPNAFSKYLDLTFETTKRQGFYAHSRRYHELMWNTLGRNIQQPTTNNSQPNRLTAHLFTANYNHEGKNHILVAWIVFLFNGVLYYPYGASSNNFRNVMASNLMMWEVIKWGKKNGARLFDMWGSLGPNPDPKDPWYGFHRFKEGYNPKLVEFIGSYDLVINKSLYYLYNVIYQVRQFILKMKSKLI